MVSRVRAQRIPALGGVLRASARALTRVSEVQNRPGAEEPPVVTNAHCTIKHPRQISGSPMVSGAGFDPQQACRRNGVVVEPPQPPRSWGYPSALHPECGERKSAGEESDR